MSYAKQSQFFSRLLLAAIALVVGALMPTRASAGPVVFVSSPAGLQADATFAWSSIPGAVGNPSSHSAGSVNFTISAGASTLQAASGGTFFLNNGNTHVILIRSISANALFRLDFSTPLAGFGTSVEWGGVEQAAYTITAFGAGNVQLFTTTILSGPQGNPAFLGVQSNLPEILAIELTATGPTPPHSFAMDDLIFQQQPVPEPTTLLLLGSGLAALGSRRVRRRFTKD